MELTTTQVSLIAALIALAAPAITYRASARIAVYVTEPEKRPDPFEAVPRRPVAPVPGPGRGVRHHRG